jgi:hypothetical protein
MIASAESNLLPIRTADLAWSTLAGAGLLAAGLILFERPLGLGMWMPFAGLLLALLPSAWAGLGALSLGMLVVHPAAGVTVIAWSVGMAGLSRWLARAPVAGAIGWLACMAWLAWPVWLSDRGLSDAATQRLVDLSVPFVLNADIDRSDPFTHRPQTYRLTRLGQDAPFSLPRSPWPGRLAYACAGAALLICVRRPECPIAIEPDKHEKI